MTAIIDRIADALDEGARSWVTDDSLDPRFLIDLLAQYGIDEATVEAALVPTCREMRWVWGNDWDRMIPECSEEYVSQLRKLGALR